MINRSVKLDIGGSEREIKFTLQAIEELEALLPGNNAFELITKEVWSITDIVTTAYCGLKHFDRKLTRQQVEQWVTNYATSVPDGMVRLRLYLLSALGVSGLFGGERSAFEDVVRALDTAGNEGK